MINGKTLGRTDRLPLSNTLPPNFPAKKKGKTVYNRKEVYRQLTKSPFIQHYHSPIWNEVMPDAEWRNVPNKRPFSGSPKYIDRLCMQIMHGSLALGHRMKYLNQLRGPGSPDATLCPVCGQRESVQHRFLDCKQAQTLWNALLFTWNQIYPREDIPLQTMLFGPSYQRDVDYNQQALADLLCGQMITIIWDDRKEYFDRPHRPPTAITTLTSRWLWKVSYALNNMVVARTLFRRSQRRWLRLPTIPPDTKFTSRGWPDQLKDLLSPTNPTPEPKDTDPTSLAREQDTADPAPPNTSKREAEDIDLPPTHCHKQQKSAPPEPHKILSRHVHTTILL